MLSTQQGPCQKKPAAPEELAGGPRCPRTFSTIIKPRRCQCENLFGFCFCPQVRCLQHGCPPSGNEPPPMFGLDDQTGLMKWRLPCHHFQASNSTNTINAASSELECAMMLAHNHKCGIPTKDAMGRVRAGGIQRQSSLHHVASCAQEYAGACHFPLLEFLSKFGTWAILKQIFISFHVWSNHKNYPPNFLSQQLFNQAKNSTPAS